MRFEVETIIIKYHYRSVAAYNHYGCLALHNNNFSFGSSLDGCSLSLDGIVSFIDGLAILIDNDGALHNHRTSSRLGDGMIDDSADGCTEDERADATVIVGGRSIVNISVVRAAIVASVVAVMTRLCKDGSCGAGYYQYEGG